MEYIVICLAAFFTSALTLFAGFGLGTLLLPVFALFFPLPVAIALTSVVHLLNNFFKLALVGKYANRQTVLRFGLPALIASFLGAWLLVWLSGMQYNYSYMFAGRILEITPVKLIIAALLAVFAIMEFRPVSNTYIFSAKYLPAGGVISGFFGGLSGHQGALRSAFLIQAGLSKEAFIGTGVVIAVLVDISRLFVYGTRFLGDAVAANRWMLAAAIASAFAGAYLGNKFLKKVTITAIKYLVTVLLLVVAVLMGMGAI
ncbi:MAG: sulfite exporter TauE/SafE family protein [Bacteroidota bacterium]|nr:sulfite exporter TauE/SafE family protein [Bacteroidota bacterium]